MKKIKIAIQLVSVQIYLSIFLKAFSVAISIFFVLKIVKIPAEFIWISSIVSFLICCYALKFFKNKKTESFKKIHSKNMDLEYSLKLYDKKARNLAEQMQLERITGKSISIPIAIDKKLLLYFLLVLLSGTTFWGINNNKKSNKSLFGFHSKNNENAKFFDPIRLISSTLEISPPSYTLQSSKITKDLSTAALSGSYLKWSLKFNNQNKLKVFFQNNNGNKLAFAFSNDLFTLKDQLISSGFYQIIAYLNDTLAYQSDFYRLETIPDLSPKIEPETKELFKYHTFKDPKTLSISAKISDDFLISNTFLIATVARGSGENIKFREIKIPITEENFKSKNLKKTIDLHALNFAPGDELYYYWAAFDNKKPEPNFSKSDTYFVVYKDTTSNEETELPTMAMNILPEYFRSQRQIIIDTQKLIKTRKTANVAVFNSKSNEIGFDQKALRLRYGQYLGEEFESNITGASHDHEENESNGDMLKGFVHAHDTEGEHENEIKQEEKHNHEQKENSNLAEKDPLASLLEEYVHAHDDGEMNTYFEQSTRSLLKMALEQMWQSELHLRLNEPEKAIPYENKALDYLKKAQQKARAYVKKSGFDPPPIKEKEKRLSGELTKFNDTQNYKKKLNLNEIRNLVAETIVCIDKNTITKMEQAKLLVIGQQYAINTTSDRFLDLKFLSLLRKKMNNKALSKKEMELLKSGLLKMVEFENSKINVSTSNKSNEALEKSFWKKL
jgi:hypothetical protein